MALDISIRYSGNVSANSISILLITLIINETTSPSRGKLTTMESSGKEALINTFTLKNIAGCLF